jgi:hypothetical protein
MKVHACAILAWMRAFVYNVALGGSKNGLFYPCTPHEQQSKLIDDHNAYLFRATCHVNQPGARPSDIDTGRVLLA